MVTNVSYTPSEKGRTYLGATLGYLFDGYNLLLTTFLLVTVSEYFATSVPIVVYAVTFALVGSVLGGIGFGWLADRMGRRPTLLITILVFGISTVLTGLSANLSQFYLFQFIAGLGVGGEWGVGFSLLNEAWGEKSRGLAGGFLQAMFPAGGLLGAVTAGYMLSHYGTAVGWRYSYIFVGLISMALLTFRIFMPESKVWQQKVKDALSGKSTGIVEKSPLKEIFNRDMIRWTFFGTLLVLGFMFYFYSGQVFYPTFFAKVGKVPATVIPLIITIGSLLGIIAEVLIGGANDKFGRKRSATMFGFISLMVIFPFFYTSMQNLAYAGNIFSYGSFYSYGLLYFFQASYAALFGVWLGEMFPTRMRATGSNFCYMVGRGVGGGLAPIMVPILAISAGGLGQGMSVAMLIGAVIMISAVFGLKETKGTVISQF